jgi:hypothetical protein
MFARLLALVCLLQFGLRLGRSEPVIPSDRQLVVYLHAGTFQTSPSLPHMQREVNALMKAAGYRVDWRVAGESSDTEADSLVVMELRGICEAPDLSTTPESLPDGAALASTAVSDGRILPFSWVNCESVTKLLGHSIAGSRKNLLYGRALGRLVAHELYHVLTKDRQHAGSGVAKSAFSARDLLADHFEFEQSALSSLRAPDPTVGQAILSPASVNDSR